MHRVDGLAVVATDLLACMLAVPPARLSADIAIGSAQRFGVSMGFGGPHAAFIAASESIARALPGRLVGVSADAEGPPGDAPGSADTRAAHPPREGDVSNICTAQVLLANVSGLYAASHGPEGLRRIAERVRRLTSMAADGLRSAGFSLVNDTWFDTLQVECNASDVLYTRHPPASISRFVDDTTVGFSFDETTTTEILSTLLGVFDAGADLEEILDTDTEGLPRRRTDEFLTQSVFSRYHTEHEMLRYLRRLADKDLALDRTMIPLGSCTMKLNATVEMEPLTWPGLADMHPFTPDDATVGVRTMIAQLEAMLVAITGYDAVSLQPNAGSQGEFAGLLAIHAYHRSRGDTGRDVCLIPSSAHGTNAAARGDGRIEGRRGSMRRPGQHRPRRSRGQGCRSGRCAGCGDGDIPVDARSVRGTHRRAVRDRASSRRAGVRRRRQPQCDGGAGATRQVRCRRQPPQSAQDVLASRMAAAGPASGLWQFVPTSPEFLPAHPLRSSRACRSVRYRQRHWARQASCRSRGRTSP